MAWGSGCTPFKTAVTVTWWTRYGNLVTTGFVLYADGTQAKGKYWYKIRTATSWLVTGLTEAAATGYDMGGTLSEGEILDNQQKRRVDASGQWNVSWDAATLSLWIPGRYPGDTDIPTG